MDSYVQVVPYSFWEVIFFCLISYKSKYWAARHREIEPISCRFAWLLALLYNQIVLGQSDDTEQW